MTSADWSDVSIHNFEQVIGFREIWVKFQTEESRTISKWHHSKGFTKLEYFFTFSDFINLSQISLEFNSKASEYRSFPNIFKEDRSKLICLTL